MGRLYYRDGTRVYLKSHGCDGCEILRINGRVAHEPGCTFAYHDAVHREVRNEPLSSEEYARLVGNYCPVCWYDSTCIDYDSIEIDTDEAYQNCFCQNCQSQWTDVYKLSGYKNLEKGNA